MHAADANVSRVFFRSLLRNAAVSDLVVKVNSPPYVLLLDLFDLVDETSLVVKAKGLENVLHMSMQKVGCWSLSERFATAECAVL